MIFCSSWVENQCLCWLQWSAARASWKSFENYRRAGAVIGGSRRYFDSDVRSGNLFPIKVWRKLVKLGDRRGRHKRVRMADEGLQHPNITKDGDGYTNSRSLLVKAAEVVSVSWIYLQLNNIDSKSNREISTFWCFFTCGTLKTIEGCFKTDFWHFNWISVKKIFQKCTDSNFNDKW